MKTEIKDEFTYSIIKCALNIHNQLGNGFREIVYHRAFAIELNKNGFQYIHEIEVPIYYDNFLVGKRRVDFIIEGKVFIELKAVFKLDAIHLAQALNYLKAYQMEKGLLINFGSNSLEVKRLIKPIIRY